MLWPLALVSLGHLRRRNGRKSKISQEVEAESSIRWLPYKVQGIIAPLATLHLPDLLLGMRRRLAGPCVQRHANFARNGRGFGKVGTIVSSTPGCCRGTHPTSMAARPVVNMPMLLRSVRHPLAPLAPSGRVYDVVVVGSQAFPEMRFIDPAHPSRERRFLLRLDASRVPPCTLLLGVSRASTEWSCPFATRSIHNYHIMPVSRR